MTFASFADTYPALLRMLLGVVVTVGISLAIAGPMRRKAVAVDAVGRGESQEASSADNEPSDPPVDSLAGRVMGFSATAFVFLLAFTLSQFWGNAQDARTATQQESAGYVRALSAAEALPSGPARADLISAIQAYRSSLINEEWPLLKQADRQAAADLHVLSGRKLGIAVNAADESSLSKEPAFGPLKDGIDSMISEGDTRIAKVPGNEAPAALIVIYVLGIASLILTAAFLPTRVKPYLLLIGIMAVLTAMLLFLVTEASNPFVGGGGAVPVPTILKS